MNGVLDIQEIIDAVDATKVNIKKVESAWSMNPIDDYEEETPGVFFYLGPMDCNEKGERCRQAMRQVVVADIVCDIADLQAVTDELRPICLGFQFTSTSSIAPDVMEFASANLAGGTTAGPLDIKNGRVWWQEKYMVRHQTESF